MSQREQRDNDDCCSQGGGTRLSLRLPDSQLSDDDDDDEDAQLNVRFVCELRLVYQGAAHKQRPNGEKLKLFLGAVIVKHSQKLASSTLRKNMQHT